MLGLKISIAGLVILTCSLVLVGCGGGSSSTAKQKAEEKSMKLLVDNLPTKFPKYKGNKKLGLIDMSGS